MLFKKQKTTKLNFYRVCIEALPELCSGELFGFKFIVPCDHVGMLTTMFGKGWVEPKDKGYYRTSELIEFRMNRSAQELPYMFRSYDKNGSLNVPESLRRINYYYLRLTGRNLTVLPTNDLDS